MISIIWSHSLLCCSAECSECFCGCGDSDVCVTLIEGDTYFSKPTTATISTVAYPNVIHLTRVPFFPPFHDINKGTIRYSYC